jgi:hypothetical protein
MNERIDNLIAECTSIYTDYNFEHGSSTVEYFDKEKFAELIVQECVNISLKSSHRYDDMGALIAGDIKEHFGVEE